MLPVRLLVVVATEAESLLRGGYDFACVVSGVGKTGAAVATTRRLAQAAVGRVDGFGPSMVDGDTSRFDAVVSLGVAGAYPSSGLEIGDVVVASEVAAIDEGLETGERFVPFSKPGMNVPGAVWSATAADLVDLLVSGPPPEFRIATGRIATVSVCAGSARLADERGRHGVLAEGMEGASIAHAAATFGVPFVEVRGISNLCGPRDGARFDLATAARNAAIVASRLLRDGTVDGIVDGTVDATERSE